MSLITTTTSTIFPYITNKDLVNIETFFAQGTWINLPSYKASWVSFGNVFSSAEEVKPNAFGPLFSNKSPILFDVESSDFQYDEELTFDISPQNSESNLKVMRGAYCTFEPPTYNVNKATKIFSGLTTGSTGIILVGNSGKVEDFNFSFTGNVSSLSGYSSDFTFNIYKYYESNERFLKPEIIHREVEHTIYENVLSFNSDINLTNLSDNEFLIKGGFIYDKCTPASKLLGIRTNTLNYLTNSTLSYVEYNPMQDWYFAYVMSALTPNVSLVTSVSQQTGSIVVESLAVNLPGVTGVTYYLNASASGDYIVHVNGVALLKNVEYITNTNNFVMLPALLSTDILTVAYLADSESVPKINSETYIVPNSIPNVTTPSIGQKLIFNTATNRYEYWLDSETSGDIILVRNGVTQSTGDYIVSDSNKRRIILFFTPSYNDTIEAFYIGSIEGQQSINGKDIVIEFNVSVAPTKVNGYFVINFYDITDTSLTTPLFNEIINYNIGQSFYSTSIVVPTIYSVGQEFFWKITNVKNFELQLTGDIISTSADTAVFKAIITSNQNNNY